ncbi:MAG: hypothetical protein B9S32_03330 [Verrucomicrobia bacterium Tous-C9LFEB]|nr:MAG: hypothetical protein B9S32_03330 [Verrucomicrobia bacterium Tous-C9LFEB]
MNFKGLLGTILIVFGGFLLFGDPSKVEWPARLGPPAVKFMKFCVDYLPYSGVVSIVLGLATWMMVKKDS